jgi:MATH domain
LDYFELLHTKGQFITMRNPTVNNFTKSNVWGYSKFIARDTMEKLYCLNSVLVISCSIRVCDLNLSPLTEPRIVRMYPGGLCEHMEKLWEKGEGFDMTFEVEGESISAHRWNSLAPWQKQKWNTSRSMK